MPQQKKCAPHSKEQQAEKKGRKFRNIAMA
jgi:hypothetical protein